MSTLPAEMITDILCRLPVKSLLRFLSTSKDMCSTIDSPDFTKLHLRRSRQSLILTGGPLGSIDLNSLEPPVEIQHPIKTAQCTTKLIGSCNGLLCLFNSDTEIIFWNMSTTKHHRVPFTPIVFPYEAASFYTHQVAYGFGYDSVHDDYKLVRIVRFRYTVDSEVMVYSLKSNSWKKLEGFPYDFHSLRSVGVLADGALHWLANLPGQDCCLITAFDLAAEEFRFVPLAPVVVDGVSQVQLRVGVWDTHFCVIGHCTGKVTNMYVLIDSWANLLSTSHPQVTGSPRCVMPAAHSGSGNEVLLLLDNKEFLWYDLKSNKVENVTIQGLPNSFDTVLYVESLVNPLHVLCGVESDGDKKKREDFLSAEFKQAL